MQIYCAIQLNKNEKKFLKNSTQLFNIEFRDELEREKREEAFMESEICFGNVRPAWLEQTTKLKWIQLESVGFGTYQNVKPTGGFIMTNLKNFFGVPVAETALAGIMTLYRGMDQFVEDKLNKRWQGASIRPRLHLLQNKRVLIMGGGNIGKQLKKLLSAFDAKITVFGTRPINSDIYTLERLDAVLPEQDILVTCLPGTDKTQGIISKERLELLKPGAIFVNVGRGSAVDEGALISMLNNNQLGGAVLDVTLKEPLPSDHPLWNCPNTLITQHSAGGYKEEVIDIVKVFLENLERFRNGVPLENVVDMEKGY